MLARLAFVLLSAAFAQSLAAHSERPYVDIEQRLSADQLHATGLDVLTPEQLALLNRLLRDEPVAAPIGNAPAATTQQIATDSDKPANAPFVTTESRTFKSRLKGTVGAWQPGTVFALENGQRWRVLKGSATLPKPLTAPEIFVVPGFAGRWFLQVTEDMPKARVERIE